MRLIPAYRTSGAPMMGLLDMCSCGHPGYGHNRMSSMHECFACSETASRRRYMQSDRVVADALHALFPTD